MSDQVSATDPDRLDLDEVRRFLARRWRSIVGTAAGCAALALLVCLLVTPVYTATTQILLDPHRQHIFGQESVAPDSALDSSIVDSQVSIITSTRLLAKVITKENLASDPEFAASAAPGLIDRILPFLRTRRAGDAEQPSLDGIDPKLAPVILHLFNRVEVARIAKSYVLSISVTSRDPGKATRLANSLSDAYVEDQVDVRARTVQQAAAFFEDRLGSLRNQVRQSEQAVADYRKAHDLVTTSMDGKVTVGEQQLQHLNEQLALAATDTAEKLARYQQATRFREAQSSVDTLPEIIRSPVVVQLRGQQADLLRRESDLSATYGPAYPAIAQIKAQRNGIDRAIAAEIRRLVSTLRNDYEVANAREHALRKTVSALTDVSGGDNDVGVKLRELERTNMANKALFENFLNRAKMTEEQSSFEDPDARLISPALQPTSPTSPKIKLIVPVAATVGLILGFVLAGVRDVVGQRAEVAAAPSRSTAFVLGRVPTADHPVAGGDDLDAYLDADPDSAFAQSIDALAAKLVPAPASDGRGQTIALAPLDAGEDTAEVAIALAAMLGRQGRRVLLIDADPDRRTLSRAFGIEAAPGLTDVMADGISASRAVVKRVHFTLLPAGRTQVSDAPAPQPLRAFLDQARSRFDLVIVDMPPLVADRHAVDVTLGSYADGLALVACWDGLMRDDFVAAVDAVSDLASFRGIVLTGATDTDEQDYALAG